MRLRFPPYSASEKLSCFIDFNPPPDSTLHGRIGGLVQTVPRGRTTLKGSLSNTSRRRLTCADATISRTDARLEKLETQVRADSEVVMVDFAMANESVEDCIRWHRRSPDENGVRFAVVRRASESDARI